MTITGGPEGGVFTGTPYQPGQGQVNVSEHAAVVAAVRLGQLLVAAFGPVRERAAKVFRLSLAGPVALCAAGVYVGSELPAADWIDGTETGSWDVATYNPPLVLQSGQSLYVVWSPTPPGQQATARVEYTEVAR